MPNGRPYYRVLVQHRTRPGKSLPLASSRHTTAADDARLAAMMILQRPRVAALGDLFVSLTVSRIGHNGTKA